MDSAPETVGDSPVAQEERRAAIRQILDRFEQAWQDGQSPCIDDYLPFHPDLRQVVLEELVQVDLELRLKAGEPVRSEDYLNRFPELAADSQFVVELATAEFDVRRRREPNLAIGEFLDRFPAHAHELTRMRPAPLSASPPSAPAAGQGDNPLLAGKLGSSVRGETVADSQALRSPPSSVRLRCPDCQAAITLASSPGGEMRCPNCGGLFRVEPEAGETGRPEPLTQIGKFRLLERIGRGAFGAVYRALDLDLDRIVAVKIPRSGAFASAEEEDRFVREARSVARLSHPAIVPVFEVGRTEAFPYIVCEFVEGVTLARMLAHRRFDFRDAAELAALIADALDHAHRHGVVHRDLKPSNIMVRPRPRGKEGEAQRVRLMDFGLARREDGEATVTVQGQILGTPAYMSPEQARGEAHRVDGRADVYSLGVILYEMLVGEPPFRGNVRMLLHQVLHDEPRPLRRLNDRIPRDLETICLKSLEKRPERRYATAGEMAADLRRWLKGEPILARPLGLAEKGIRWAQARPAIAFLSALTVLVTVAAFAAISWQLRQTEAARSNERAARVRSEQAGQALKRSLRREQAALQIAHRERMSAEKARREVENRLERVSQAHRLATASESERTESPIRSLLLAVEALELTHRPGERRVLEAEQSLRDALSSPGADVPPGFEGPFADLTAPAHGRWLVVRKDEQSLVCYDLESANPKEAAVSVRDAAGFLTAMVSPDGRWLAALGGDNEVLLAALAPSGGAAASEFRYAIGPAAFESGYWLAAFSPDGRWFAAAGQDRQVRLWRLDGEPRAPRAIGGHDLSVRQVLFSPDSRRLLTASYDRTVRIHALPGEATPEPETVARAPAQDADGTPANAAPATGTPATGTPATGTPATGAEATGAEATGAPAPGDLPNPLVLFVGRVPEAFFAPGGRWLLTTNQDSAASLWDLEGDEPDSPAMTRVLGRFVTPSPDGKWMIIHADMVRPSFFSRLWVWRIPDAPEGGGAPVIAPPLRLGFRISSAIQCSPDGRWLAAIPSDGSVRLWRLDADNSVESFQDLPAADAVCLSFSADSQMLAVGGEQGAVSLWRREGQAWSNSPEKFPGRAGITAVRIDQRHGRLIAGDRDGALKIWPLQEGSLEQPAVIRRHETQMQSLALATSSRWLISTSDDGDSRLWDLSRLNARLSPLRPPGIPTPGPTPSNFEAAPGYLLAPQAGGLIVSLVNDSLRLWRLTDEERASPLAILPSEGFVPACADVSDDLKWLACASADGEVRVWRLSPEETGADWQPPIVLRTAVEMAPPSPEASPARLEGTASPRPGPKVAFGRRGGQLVFVDAREGISLWRRAQSGWSLVKMASPQVGADEAWFASGDADVRSDRWLITAQRDADRSSPAYRGISLWDLAAEDGVVRRVPSGLAEDQRLLAIRTSRDGRWLAAADGLGAIHLWRLPSVGGGPRAFLLPSATTGVVAMDFSHDSARLAVGGETKGELLHSVRLFDLAGDVPAEEPIVLPGHAAPITALAFTSRRRKLVTGGADGSIRIWNLEDEEQRNNPLSLRGHDAAIRALAATGDSLRVASAAADGTVRLWSLEVLSQPPIRLASDGLASDLQVAGADRFLVASGARGPQIWRLVVDDLIRLARTVAGRELTDEERRHYLIESPPGIH